MWQQCSSAGYKANCRKDKGEYIMWWQWLIFALILVLIPLGLVSIKNCALKKITPTKEETKATGEQENESIGTETTIVTEPQEMLSVSSSSSASTIGLGLGAYVGGATTGNVSTDLKRWGKFGISYIISLWMIQSGSFISDIYEWGKELVLDVPDAEDLIESIPLLGESTTIISSPPLEEKYYRESV